MEHDYTVGSYGHDVLFYPRAGALEGTMHGWGDGVKVGDHIIFFHNGARLRFHVRRIKYLPQAPGHWYASVDYAPVLASVMALI